MLKSIFFDFNGVIIDDESLQMKAYQEVLSNHGISLTEEWYLDGLGMDDKTFVRYAFDRAQKSLNGPVLDEVLTGKAQLHRTMIEGELPLFPGVVTFLKASSRRFALGLVSMASNAEVSYVLNRSKIASCFSVVITAGDVTVCKPAPDCYRFALGKLNEIRQRQRHMPLLPEECLAIEDSPPGIKSARDAGMRTLGVTNTVTESELREAGAEVVTPSLADWTVAALELVYR